jgi:hypothetical protein
VESRRIKTGATGERHMKNIQHSTFNLERRSFGARMPSRWAFNVLFLILLFATFLLSAQAPPQLPPGGLIQLQVAQPPVDNSPLPVTATAMFDPPTVRAGEKTFYRVTVAASDQSVQWPEKIAAPAELKLGAVARGQMMQLLGNRYRPVTAFTYEARTTTAGSFTISNFVVNVAGQPVEIPAANLEILPANSPPLPAAGELELEASATNVYLGQPVRVRVLLPASQGNEIEALREVQINGGSVMTDKTSVRQAIETVKLGGQLKQAFVYEATVTPIAAGPLQLTAQAFTAGREFGGPITITGQVTLRSGPPRYDLLVSEPLELKVRPLPTEGELPGFTGAMGVFIADKPQLATNRIHVGEPVRLQVAFHGIGILARFVPPVAPRSRDWQIIADPPPATGFTLIPLTDDVQATPAIPFCSFNPAAGEFVDLTIPALPVTVIGDRLPTQLAAFDETENQSAPLKLSDLATSPGKMVASLQPLQLRGWFIVLQLVPAFGFFALWQWDRRRRFLAAHPEIVRRRKARRALRREKVKLQKAAATGDANGFVQHAAEAMKIACAPHFPAHPRALVCGEVLTQLEDPRGIAAETVRKIFAAADAQFASVPPTPADLLALHSDVTVVLNQLEEKL